MAVDAPSEPDAWVDVGEGIELAIWCHGPEDADGPPFLLVHGLASNAHLWDGVAAALAGTGHRSVAVDLRGHGRSSKPDGPYHLDAVAGDLARLVPRLGTKGPWILVGQSYGAIVVLAAAGLLGDEVSAVACVDGGHIDLRRRFPEWPACERLLAPPRSEGLPAAVLEARIRESHKGWPETGTAGFLACFERRPDGTVAPWLTYERHIEVLRGLWSADTEAIRRSTKQPTLLLSADDGMPAKAEDVERALAQLPAGEGRWMKGHHDLHAQHPEALAAALVELAGAT